MADQPTSIAASFPALQAAFLPDRATGVDKTLQFDFSGREAGTWNMCIHDGVMEYGQGPATNPNATIAVDSDDWLNILSGALNPVSAFMSGKIKA
jgi:putative sterol carrier protein